VNKNHLSAKIEKNALSDEGNGLITVKGGLTLTDESVQHSGTKYDVKSLDIDSDYNGTLFANHGDDWGGYTIETVIGKLVGVHKKGKRVVADAIQYFLDNPLGLLAYNGTAQGFLTDYSIGTIGPEPEEDGTFKNHKLFEVSQVGIGNNRNAKLNEMVVNSIKQAKSKGMDTSELEKALHLNEAEEEVEEPVKEIKEETNMSKDENTVSEEQTTETNEQKVDLTAQINAAVEAKTKEMAKELAEVKNAFDKQATEPEFTLDTNSSSFSIGDSVKNTLSQLDYKELHQQQIEFARRMLVSNSSEAASKLETINGYNLDRLKSEGIAKNSITIGDMGNFVISPELISEIQGCRNDYDSLLNETTWQETLSTQMAWLERSGDIDMKEVDFCEDSDGSVGSDGNLKPVSEYGANIKTSNLSEVAAVTPICNAATRFLAVDILSDVAAGYRKDYDRKRAQLVIARLEQAVDANGNSVAYSSLTDPKQALISFLDTFGEISTCTPTGVYIMSDKSIIELKKQLILAGGSDVFNQVFFNGQDGVPTINGQRYVVVPSDLLPTLGTSETRAFEVDGATVTINHAVFYLDTSNFTGRISGGLQYDLATQASYESGGQVKSAFQRNEIVLRGSFFRGGAVKDSAQVSGLLAPAVS